MVVRGIRIVRTPRITGVLFIIIIGWLSSAPGTARVPWIATAAATIAATTLTTTFTTAVAAILAAVVVAAKRARQINAYYSQLGEGLLEYVGPLVETHPQEKPLSIALREIDESLLLVEKVEEPAEESP